MAASVNPYTTLIDDTFHCHNWGNPDFGSADRLIYISGNSYSTDAGSGAIQRLDGNDDYDIEFQGGPLDGEAVDVNFSNHGQNFYISPGERPATRYQTGGSAVLVNLNM